jgi:purine-nucleoside phosphorylase
MNPTYKKLQECHQSVSFRLQKAGFGDFKPQVALVLGSGLGDFAAERIEVLTELDYADISGFPVSTVPGHAGKFVFGRCGTVPIVCMKGRIHCYEGYHVSDVVLPTRLMRLLGAEILFLTNASGGIAEGLQAGDLMLITDHIGVFVENPLRGANIDELGTRFPDMSHVYNPALNQIIRETAKRLDIRLPEGVYAQTAGPSFETPAEIQMLARMGASAVGMSTAVEAIAANHMGMKVCGISCVCNLAAGLSPTPLTHEEVQEAARAAAPRFKNLLTESIKGFANVHS